jgi:DNA-binding MarR family transcriptional regulator
MVNFHEEIRDDQHAKELLEICAREIQLRIGLRISNKPSIRFVEEIKPFPHAYAVYGHKRNVIELIKGADATDIVHELVHANIDHSGGYHFNENTANYFTFLVCGSLPKTDVTSEKIIRDFLRGMAITEKIRGIIGDALFSLLVKDFYAGLNEILKAVTGEQLTRLEVDVLKFLTEWSYLRHAILEYAIFTPEDIAKKLRTKKSDVIRAIDKLKKLKLLEECSTIADSILRHRVYELCEQYAKTKNQPMSFFYR